MILILLFDAVLGLGNDPGSPTVILYLSVPIKGPGAKVGKRYQNEVVAINVLVGEQRIREEKGL